MKKSVKIALASIGSRGDIQPYIALGKAFQQRGHEVCLVTHPWAKQLVEAYGLPFIPAGDNIDIHYAARKFVENSKSTMQGLKFALTFIFDNLRNCHEDFKKAFKDMDLIIGHGIVGQAEAEMLDKPFVRISIETMGLEKVYWQSNNIIKECAIAASDLLGKQLFGKPYVTYRKDLGLPAKPTTGNHSYLALIPISPMLQKPHPNWKPITEITGYFLADTPATYEVPDTLRNFLTSGDKPVLVTFGSMFHRQEDAQKLFKTVTDAIGESGLKGLILMPDIDTESMTVPENILLIDSVPYSWLLRRVELVVHHFGFGTTAEVLAAGLPSIPIPHIFDQNIRAKQIHKLGYAYKPLNKDKMTAQQLSEAINDVRNDGAMGSRCREVSEKISKENGIEKAIEIIHQSFN